MCAHTVSRCVVLPRCVVLSDAIWFGAAHGADCGSCVGVRDPRVVCRVRATTSPGNMNTSTLV